MEVTLKEVTTMTINKSSFERMVRDLSGNAIKVFIAAAMLKLDDWATVVPSNALNNALIELSINGYAFPQGEGTITFPDLYYGEETSMYPHIKD